MLPKRLKILSEHRVLIPLLVGILSALLVIVTLHGGSPEEVLGALPAILIAIALACGHYPGEDVIRRLGAPRRNRRPKAPPAISPLRPRRATVSDRLAYLAGSRPLRGPPALAIPTTR
jgi:hypothetical protein